MKNLRLAFFLCLGIVCCYFLGGCCYMKNGSTQEISFNSNPEGATIDFNGTVLGKTPSTINVERKQLMDSKDPKFTFSKDGYEPVTVPIVKKWETLGSACIWGDAFICVLGTGMLPGLSTSTTIEKNTGYGTSYSLNQYYALLLPKGNIVPTTQIDSTRQYIVANYGYLIQELEDKKGPYLDALIGLLNVSKDGKAAAIDKISDLSESNKDVFKFADRVIEAFGVK